jgi:hypothetical protein
MDPARAGPSRRGGRGRRTRQQIRQQTLPVGNLYVNPSSECRLPRSAHDVQSPLPLTGFCQEDCSFKDPSEGNTTQGPGIEIFRAEEIGHFRACASTERDLDLGEGIDSDFGVESEPEEFEVESFVDLESTEKDADPVAKECFSTNFSESEVPSIECTVTMEQKNATPVDSSIRRERLLQWQSIFALLVTCGTVRMTVKQYELIYTLHAWASSKANLPSIRTVQRNLMPAIRDFAYARSSDISLRIKDAKRSDARQGLESGNAGVTTAIDSVHRENEKESVVRIVLPSEWARLDCRTAALYEAMFGSGTGSQASGEGSLCFSDIDQTPLIRNRKRFLDTRSQIYVDPIRVQDSEKNMERLPIHARGGDLISVGILRPDKFAALIGQDQHLRAEGENVGCLVAKVVGVWGIEGGRPTLNKEEESKASPSFSFCSMLRNGDTVAELVPGFNDPFAKARSIYLLVFRFCRTPGEPSRELIMVDRSLSDGGILNGKICIAARVASVRMHKQAASHEARCFAPRTGVLQDGRKYVVYRALLYTDDFQPFTSRKGSYGGCYMLPLGLAPDERAGYAAVRCLGLTPPNVSSNEVLLHVIPDIVKCTTDGVEGKTAFGESVTIFLDIVAYIGDYPAVSHVLDVLGHTARAPCHLCSFVRQDRTGDDGLKYYGYSTTVHSRASSFCREARRVKSVRHSECPSSTLQLLGLKQFMDESHCPLHALSNALDDCRSKVPLTDSGVPVVPAVFDPYRSSMVAPDHLLVGLARDVINATLCMCSPRIRRNAESLMRDALRDHNLGMQSELISIQKAVLHTMNLSEVYAVLLVAPYCFRSSLNLKPGGTNDGRSSTEPACKIPRIGHTALEQIKRLVLLIERFQTLVSETQYRPRVHVDGLQAVLEFNEGDGKTRLDRLFNLACGYISELHHVCTLFPKAVRDHLSKPNVHRLLELYAHSLPAFGQIGHFQELLFETAHQPLKRGIKKSNNHKPHLAAVTAVLANDWETRLALCVACGGDPEEWSDETCRQVQNIVTGDENMDSRETFRVKSAFCPPVLSQLQNICRRLLSLPSSGVMWKIEHASRGRLPSFAGTWRAPTTLRSQIGDALACFKFWVLESGFYNEQVRIGTWASSRNKHHTGEELSFTFDKRRECLQPGSVVQSLVSSLPLCSRSCCSVKVLNSPTEGVGSSSFIVSYWLVLELFEAQYGCVAATSPYFTERTTAAYAIVIPCLKTGHEKGKGKFYAEQQLSDEKLFRVDIESAASVLPLNESTRVVVCIPACNDGACVSDEATGRVKHSCELTKGCLFYGLGRRDGYPPRVA